MYKTCSWGSLRESIQSAEIVTFLKMSIGDSDQAGEQSHCLCLSITWNLGLLYFIITLGLKHSSIYSKEEINI